MRTAFSIAHVAGSLPKAHEAEQGVDYWSGAEPSRRHEVAYYPVFPMSLPTGAWAPNSLRGLAA